MTDAEMKILQHAEDVATLRFWDAIQARRAADREYDIAEQEMFRAKTNNLRAKVAKAKAGQP